MHALIGVLGVGLIALVLTEFFVTFLLPRRVKRDPRIARQLYTFAWIPWRALARHMRPAAADTFLGFFGPLGLLFVLGVWTVGLILGFAALQWAIGTHLDGRHAASVADALYFSGGALFSASTNLSPTGTVGHILRVAEAASGFGVIAIVIGYLPSLYQAFSRRETAVSQIDPRAGSPPTAEALLRRSAERGGWSDLNAYLREWEEWAAELMETHLSYPVLTYFRSQHVNQNWLSALVTIMDTCAFTMAAAPPGSADDAEMTYRIGRHALSDLSYSFHVKPALRDPDRLPPEDLERLIASFAGTDLLVEDEVGLGVRLNQLRATYENSAGALADSLALTLPEWLDPEERAENWRQSGPRARRGQSLH